MPGVHDPEGFFAVAAFVRAALPPLPARVLEIGAGSGELAALLREGGYDVVAVDPASTSSGVTPAALTELDEPPASFDAAVAVVSLHHVEPLEASCAHLATLLRPGAVLLIDEFDVARFDERAAAWQLDRAEHAPEHVPRTPAEFVAQMRGHLHSLERITGALSDAFEVAEPLRGAYLYRWLVPPGLRDAEERLIAEGALPATGARLRCVRH